MKCGSKVTCWVFCEKVFDFVPPHRSYNDDDDDKDNDNEGVWDIDRASSDRGLSEKATITLIPYLYDAIPNHITIIKKQSQSFPTI